MLALLCGFWGFVWWYVMSKKRYIITVQRQKIIQNVKKPNSSKPAYPACIGTLTITDTETNQNIFTCKTLESGLDASDTAGQRARIMPRSYYIDWTWSARNETLGKTYTEYRKGTQNKAVWVKSSILSNFASRRILIHIGNYPQDTDGCILLGESANMQAGTITQSTQAIVRFFRLLEAKGISNFELVIKAI